MYGLLIESTLPLPGALEVKASGAAPDVVVAWEDRPSADWTSWRTRLAAANDAQPTFSGTLDGHVLLAWRDELRFVISPARDRVLVVCTRAKLEFAPTVLIGFVLGYLLHLRGVVCLHGSVLARGSRGFALLGPSGAGKSTLAAALVLAGAQLVSDDLTVVRQPGPDALAEPGAPAVRLGATAVEHLLGPAAALAPVPHLRKGLWEPSRGLPDESRRTCDGAVALRTIYVLEVSPAASKARIDPPLSIPRALRRLVATWYPPGHLSLLTQDRLRDLSALAAGLPVQVVRHSKRWEELPALVERLGT
jgi:hypothetical protein